MNLFITFFIMAWIALGSISSHAGTVQATGGTILRPVPPSPDWTDDTLTAGATTIKAAHFNELRNDVNAKRVACGLPPQVWSEPVVAKLTPIRKIHIDEIRAGIAGIPGAQASFTDQDIKARQTPIKAIHIAELRFVLSSVTCGVPVTDCFGSWSLCTAGSQIYTVTQPASPGGAACPAATGATRACQNCPNPTRVFWVNFSCGFVNCGFNGYDNTYTMDPTYYMSLPESYPGSGMLKRDPTDPKAGTNGGPYGHDLTQDAGLGYAAFTGAINGAPWQGPGNPGPGWYVCPSAPVGGRPGPRPKYMVK